MNRHVLREQVFKLLFRYEFNSTEDMPEQVRFFLENTDQTLGIKDAEFVQDTYNAIAEKLPEIDRTISDNLEKWDVARIGKVELTVLRVAAYEILFNDDIPTNVSINEAIEIAKKYGQENSGAFVNAVLVKLITGDDK